MRSKNIKPNKMKSRIHKKIQAKPKKNKVIDNDKLDSDVLFDIAKYLRKKHHILMSRIKIEYSIKFTHTGYKILDKKTHMEISNIVKKYSVRTPDIIVLDKNKILKLIIEQDGKSHESESQIKKDKKRNNLYTKAGIPFIIISTKQLKSKKKAWHSYLDDKLAELDIEL